MAEDRQTSISAIFSPMQKGQKRERERERWRKMDTEKDRLVRSQEMLIFASEAKKSRKTLVAFTFFLKKADTFSRVYIA